MEQFCQDNNKIAIVGAGPAGIYCALNILKGFENLNFNKFKIDIYDKAQALRTILPTGGSRCNITNSISDIKQFALNYPRGEKFLYSLFSKHFNYESIEFFKNIGIDTYIQDDGRVFPKSNSAKDVKDKMLNALKKYKNVKLINKHIKNLNELKQYSAIVVANGSKDDSFFLKSLNQPLIPFRRALCGLIVENFKYPQGVSVKTLDGDLVFTSDGISGPLPFKISSLNVDKKFPYDLSVRLFEVNDLLNLIKENPKKTIGNLVSNLVPKSLARVIVDEFDKKAAEISREKINKYSVLNFKIIGLSKQGEIVHAGGVDLKYIDKNCKSKLYDNIWFCGEVLDIDGFCGGFNLQNCWSSAYVVANDVIRFIIEK